MTRVRMSSSRERIPGRLKKGSITKTQVIKMLAYLIPAVFLLQVYLMVVGKEGSRRADVTSVAQKKNAKTPAINSTASESKGKTAEKSQKRLEFVHITKTGGSAIEKAGSKVGIIWGACHYMSIEEVGCSKPDISYKAPNYQSYALTSPWHTPPKLLKHYVEDEQYPYSDADLFVVIRNPYSRILSEYYCPWQGFQAKFRKDTVHEKDPNDPAVMNQWVKSMVTRLDGAMAEFKDQKDSHLKREQAKGLNEDKYILAQKHYVNQAEYVYDGDKVVVKNIVHYENLSKEYDALMKKYGIDSSLPPKEKGGTYTDKNKKRLSHTDLHPDTIALINKFAKPDFEKFGYQMVEKFEKDDDYSLEAKINTDSSSEKKA